MEFEKLTNEELKALDANQSLETEMSIRHNLAKLRMDIYSEKGKHTAKVKQLKKNLARVLTFRTEKMRARNNP